MPITNSNHRELQAREHIARLSEEYRVVLSDGAAEMLLLPLREYFEVGMGQELEDWRMSVAQIFETITKEEPTRLDLLFTQFLTTRPVGTSWPVRTTTSIIRAFSKHFCNIPPFCGRT